MSSFNSDRSRMDFYNQKRKPDPVPTYGGEDPCVNDRPNGNQPESGFVSKLWKEAVSKTQKKLPTEISNSIPSDVL